MSFESILQILTVYHRSVRPCISWRCSLLVENSKFDILEDKGKLKLQFDIFLTDLIGQKTVLSGDKAFQAFDFLIQTIQEKKEISMLQFLPLHWCRDKSGVKHFKTSELYESLKPTWAPPKPLQQPGFAYELRKYQLKLIKSHQDLLNFVGSLKLL